MTAPTYFAMGGCIFVKEHAPITIQKARLIENIHRMNAAYQMSAGDERSLTARLGLAKIEQSLADEMAAAIAAITTPQEIAA